MTAGLKHLRNIHSRKILCGMLVTLCLGMSACTAAKKPITPLVPTESVKAAMDAYSAGNCKESITYFTLALQQFEHTTVYNGLGMSYLLCEQPQSAIPIFEKAISQTPGSAALHTNLGTAFFKNGNIASAKREFQKAIKLDPMYVSAIIGLAGADISEGNPEKALRSLFDLERTNPNILEISYNKALAFHAMGLAKDAEPLMQAYVDAFPDDAHARNALAIILLENEKLSEARTHLDKAIQIYPVEGAFYYNRANISTKQHNLKEAKADYDRALAFLPDMPEAYVNRGDLRFLLNDAEGACEDLEKACSLSPAYCDRLKSYRKTGRCDAGL